MVSWIKYSSKTLTFSGDENPIFKMAILSFFSFWSQWSTLPEYWILEQDFGQISGENSLSIIPRAQFRSFCVWQFGSLVLDPRIINLVFLSISLKLNYLPIESIELGIHGLHSSKSDSANLVAKHL